MSPRVSPLQRQRLKSRDPVWEALNALSGSLDRIYGNSAPEMVLYGSQARGDAREESDVDVLLLFPHPIRASAEIRRVSPLLAEINLRYGVLVSILPTDRHAFENAEGAFWSNVRREGVRVGAH